MTAPKLLILWEIEVVDALVAAPPFNPGRGSEPFWRTTTYHLDAPLLPEAAREALDVGRARLACHRVRPITEFESERVVLARVASGRFSA